MATTVTVGTSARDYSTIQAAWNALPSTLDDDYIFDLYADSEFTAGLDTSASTKTMGSFTVTIRPAAGQGFRDHANKLTNALRYNPANGVAIAASAWNSYVFSITHVGVILDGLQIRNAHPSEGGAVGADQINIANLVIRNCILDAASVTKFVIGAQYPFLTAINNVIIQRGDTGTGVYYSAGMLKGNIIVYVGSGTSSGRGVFLEWNQSIALDNAVFGFATAFHVASTTYHSSSDYNATDQAATGTGTGSNNLTSLDFADQFEAGRGTVGSEDLRVKAGSALIGAGVADAALTLDILGQTRADPPTIGAHEYVAPLVDETAPTLTNPTATATGQTTASGSVTTDEGNGTLYWLASANSTESAATVKGGDSQAVTGTGVQNVSFTGLTAATPYYPHYVHVDAADNESNVASGSQFTTDAPPPPPDAPTIGAVSNLTHNSVTINWTDNSDNETGFKVEYGVSSGGTVASWSAAPGSPAAANATSLGLAGLTPEETYKGRVAATNDSGDSSWVETAEFTTEAAPAVGTKGVIIDLGAGAANESGIYVRYQDDDTGGSEPDYTDESASADAQGRIVLNLASVTALNMGDEGFVLAFKQGADRTDDLIAGGRVPIVDISE